MAKSNTSAMGRLYKALHAADLAGAQKAALDLQPSNSGKGSPASAPNVSHSSASTKTALQVKAQALVTASQAAQQSSLMEFMGLGGNVNTLA